MSRVKFIVAAIAVLALALSVGADESERLASCRKCSVIEKSLMRITGADQKTKWDIMLVHDWCQLLPTKVHTSKCLDSVMQDDMKGLARMVDEHHRSMCHRSRICDLSETENGHEAQLAFMTDALVQLDTEDDAELSKLPVASRVKHLFGKRAPSWRQIKKYGRRTVRYMRARADRLFKRYKMTGSKRDHARAFKYSQKAKRVAKMVAMATRQRSHALMAKATRAKRAFEAKFDSRDTKQKAIPTRYNPEPRTKGSIYGGDNPTPRRYDHPTPGGKMPAGRGASDPAPNRSQTVAPADPMANVPLAGADPFALSGQPTAAQTGAHKPHDAVAATPNPYEPGFQEAVAPPAELAAPAPLNKSPLTGPAAYTKTSASASSSLAKASTTYASGKTWAPTDPFATGADVPAPPAPTPLSQATGANPNVAPGLRNLKYPHGVEKPNGRFDDKAGTNDINPGTPAQVTDPAAFGKTVNEDASPLMTQASRANPGKPALDSAASNGAGNVNPGNAGTAQHPWEAVGDLAHGDFGTSRDSKSVEKSDAAP